jgi:two-component system cell cycle sensor histidine kinase/response regulator CckA
MDSNAAAPSPDGKAHATLVVDDDTQVLRYVSRMLGSIGCECVYQAASSGEALDLWREHQAGIGLLVSDFVMPEVTGDHLALRLLRDKPELKVLFISGNDPFTLDSAIPLVPGRNFLQKPFTVSDIRKSVANL